MKPILQKKLKKVYINFNKQGLTIQEKCTFTELKDSSEDKENNLVAENGNYLIKAELSHYITLIEENDVPRFRHVIAQPEYKCKHLELQKCLNQKKLLIWEPFKNLIRKIFQIEFEPNRSSFFQKPCYQTQIISSQINMQDDSSNLLENSYTKITNHS